MNDALIRANLHRKVLGRYHSSPDALVIDELGLRHGKCRADIAVIKRRLIGYEIKSDEDSLKRLDKQVQVYSTVFDSATIVVGSTHEKAIQSLVPEWWGILVGFRRDERDVGFRTLRHSSQNKHIDPCAVAQLLWCEEAAAILEELGESAQVLRQRRSVLYGRLADRLSLAELRRRVTSCLKSRKDWRFRVPQTPSGDSFPRAAR